METITKYSFIAFLVLLLISAFYILLVSNQRDEALERLDRANSHITQLQQSNINLKGSIHLLEKQAQQNRDYITDLESKRTNTEQEANKLAQEFKTKKNENQTINKWASQPLPNGLY